MKVLAQLVLLLQLVASFEVEEGRGVFKFPLKINELQSKKLGNWTDADELFGWKSALEPMNNLDSYLYSVNCIIGNTGLIKKPIVQQCLFDTSTPISSTFSPSFKDFSNVQWDKDDSKTVIEVGKTARFESIGLTWEGERLQDQWCIGDNENDYTTLCLFQDFVYITEQVDKDEAQYDPPYKIYADKYEDVEDKNGDFSAILGLGRDPNSEDWSYDNFIDLAYEADLLESRMFAFQGA